MDRRDLVLVDGLRSRRAMFDRLSGCVCVEVSGMVSSKKDYDPIAAAKKCFAKLKPAFEK